MNNERPPIRVFGQRSISSSFLSRSSNPFKSSNDDSQSKLAKKNSQLSLSDFLDRKLPETSVPQRTVKGKSTPFSSLQGPRNSNNAPIAIDCGTDSQTESAISKVLFEQFKRSEPSQCEYLVSGSASESQTRKMNVVVIGGDPRPEQKGMQPIPIARNKKPKPLYNHCKYLTSSKFFQRNHSETYHASGSGWWDSNMEGVDSEEVGLGEVWEGVGSTTLGGIEWH
uniref:Uncharacterized protein n=1 Tax=Cucumis melo TaxID=3656 RepID=A0A9I9CNU2_CUCME